MPKLREGPRAVALALPEAAPQDVPAARPPAWTLQAAQPPDAQELRVMQPRKPAAAPWVSRPEAQPSSAGSLQQGGRRQVFLLGWAASLHAASMAQRPPLFSA